MKLGDRISLLAIERAKRRIWRLRETGQAIPSDLSEALVRRFPREPDFRILLGEQLQATSPEEAAEQFRSVMRLGSDSGSTVLQAAFGLFRVDALDEAERAANVASSLIGANDLFYPDVLNLRGLLAARRFDFARAESLLRDAATRRGDFGPFWADLVAVVLHLGRFEDARQLIARVEREIPGYDTVWLREMAAAAEK